MSSPFSAPFFLLPDPFLLPPFLFFLFSLQNRQPAGTNTLCNRCEYGQRRVGNDRFYAEIFPCTCACKRKLRLPSPGKAGLEGMRSECMVGHMCTFLVLNRFVHLKSLNMQLCRRRSPSTPTHLPLGCCSIGCSRAPESSDNCPFGVECCAQRWVRKASGWVWRGAIFMCLLVRRLRWSAATPSSTARVPSTTPPLPLLGLAAGSSQRCSSPMTCGTPPQASLSATTAAARDRLAS